MLVGGPYLDTGKRRRSDEAKRQDPNHRGARLRQLHRLAYVSVSPLRPGILLFPSGCEVQRNSGLGTISPEKAPIDTEKAPIVPKKARFSRKDLCPIFSELIRSGPCDTKNTTT